MELKKQSVKQRRLERLKRLQELGERNEIQPSFSPSGLPPVREDLRVPSQSGRQAAEGRWDDPEYVWRQKLLKDGNGERGGLSLQAEVSPLRFSPPTVRQLWFRLAICAVLFAAVWMMFRLPYPWAQAGRQYVTAALTEPMNTDALSAWYESKFRGTPSILPSFHRSGEESIKASSGGNRTYFAPVKGTIAQPYNTSKQGITLVTKQDAPVYAMDTGLVTFAGVKEETGFTVVISHPNGIQTVYGDLAECRLEVNDWIKGGEAIGKAASDGGGGTFYFAVQKDGRFVNPADVVAIVP